MAIHNLHDNSFKAILNEHELFAEFLRDFTDIDPLKHVCANDIQDMTERYIPLFQDSKESDSVKRVNISGCPPVFIIVLTEHQSTVNFRMAFRMLQYIVLILDAYEKEVNAEGDISGKKDFRYPLVLPIVFYDGEGEWTAETNFLQKTEPNGPLYAKYIPTFEYMVVNLNKLSREALLRFGDPLSFMMLIDKIRRPEDMSLLSGIPAGYVRSFSDSLNEGIKKLLVDVITSLLVRADIPHEEIDAVTDDIQERRYSEMFDWLEGYSVQETRRQIREEERQVREEERRVWEEKLRQQAEAQCQQAEAQRQQADREKAVLEERIRYLEQAVKEQGLRL
ncbi:MAG: Rpn family recombination-promoting nuclease/putative transposase [Treponema sp.]|jgi:hypothetical protein|nr:Rpn family recombination-promoting nuclease/putative transposase [Treponema sp.]